MPAGPGRRGIRPPPGDKFAELLPEFERVFDPEHLRTLIARANHARWTGEAGDPAAARDKFAELLPEFERVLGPEHPRTEAARADSAYWTERAGRGPGA